MPVCYSHRGKGGKPANCQDYQVKIEDALDFARSFKLYLLSFQPTSVRLLVLSFCRVLEMNMNFKKLLVLDMR